MASSPPPSPMHRRQSSNFSMSSSKRLSRSSMDRMSLSRRSSAAFGSSQGPGGDSLALELGGDGFGESLADELDGYSDEDGEVIEEDDEDEEFRRAEQERDSGIDVASSPPHMVNGSGKHLSPVSAAKTAGHRRKESKYDGSEYGSESDLEETELVSATLEARMAAVEAMARRGLEENGSEGDRVVGKLTDRLRDLGSQGDVEMGVTRLSTAYTALSTHLTNQTRIIAQLTSHLISPLMSTMISHDLLEEMDPLLSSTISILPTLLPSSRPPQAIHTLLAETADLIQDLNYLKDTLQVNQQTTTAASRKLRAAKDVLRETRSEMDGREKSIKWLEAGDWEHKLASRRAASECHQILDGFQNVCDGWGARILEQEGAIGVAM